jgi:fructose-1,6-bisphosphatase/inositol monophosphatase family enzyme
LSLANPQGVVDKLRAFQRAVRDTIIASRTSAEPLHEVSRTSSADTIYRIDTAVEALLEDFFQAWGQETPLVLIAEGLEDHHGKEGPMVFPHGAKEDDAHIRVIVDPVDGTREIMYDKRAAWALAGVAPNKGPHTRLRDIEVAVMTELPTSKMGFADVLWAIKGRGAMGVRERLEPEKVELLPVEMDRHAPIGKVLTKLGKVDDHKLIEALNAQQRKGGLVGEILVGMGYVNQKDVQIAVAFQKGDNPNLAPEMMSLIKGERLNLRRSTAETINHGFATVSNFFPGTKVLASELMEHLVRSLIGPADVTQATVFDDQYISTGGQFYELIVGHDRFNADLRPLFYRLQDQPEGLCCHPYDCAGLLIAEEAGVIITAPDGNPLDGPLDTTTGLSWIGYANPTLRAKIEPLIKQFIERKM